MIKNLVIVQARINSSRFPNKVLKEVEGIPLILFLLKRLSYSKKINKVVLATSYEKTDNQLFNIVKQSGYDVFRGSLNDVLGRFYQCSNEYKSKNVIRITGDCPLIDPLLVDELICEFEKGKWDYISNCSDENNLSVPDGFDTEIFKSRLLKIANEKASLSSEREHVTPWFRSKESGIKWTHFVHSVKRDFYRVTLDYPEDFKVISAIIKNLGGGNKFFTVDDVVFYLKNNPEVAEINKKFIRNDGYLKSLKNDNIDKNSKNDG